MMPTNTYRNSITREEFVELRGTVMNIAASVQALTNSFAAEIKEREMWHKAEIARLETETRGRFEKNEEGSYQREKTNVEGRRWMIGVLAGLVVVLITIITLFGTSIKDSTLSAARIERQPLETGVATLLNSNNNLTQVTQPIPTLQANVAQLNTSTNNLTNTMTTLQLWSNKVDGENAASITDRTELNRRQLATFDTLEELQKTVAAMKAEISEKLRSLDDKFTAEEQISSAGTTDLWRVSSVLWNALSNMGAKMPQQPTAPYFVPSLSDKPH